MYETMVVLNVADNILYESQRQVDNVEIDKQLAIISE